MFENMLFAAIKAMATNARVINQLACANRRWRRWCMTGPTGESQPQ
nr:hypothetical protein [Pararhizobium sp. IMCC3301]